MYYASVYAHVNIDNDVEEELGGYVSTSKRIIYGVVRFETSAFAAPIELLTAFIALIAISILSCMLLQGSFVR